MAALTRSASLTDIPEKDERGKPNSDDISKERSRGINIYGSPQKASGNTLNRRSSADNPWKWLSNTKVSSEDRSRSQRGGLMYSSTSNDPERSKGDDTHNGSTGSLRKNRYDRLEAALPRFVDHLETLLPQFCLHLSHPTYQEVATAMSLLLNNPPAVPVVESGMSFSSFVPGSPAEKKYQQRSRQNSREKEPTRTSVKSLLSSPFRSRPRKNKWQEDGNSSRNWTPLSSLGTQSSSSSVNNSVHNPNSLRTRASSFSDKLDAAAWQSFVAPLVLLAGAEAIYADLEHVHPTPSIIQWGGLYQRVYSELMATIPPPPLDEKPPELRSPPLSPPQTSGSSLLPPGPPLFPDIRTTINPEDHGPTTPKKANKSQPNGSNKEWKHIRSLLVWLELKCQWLPLHESLFLAWTPNNLTFMRAFEASLPPNPVPDGLQAMMSGSGCGRRLMVALRHEIQATLSLMEMGFSLERGRFLETVVNARKVKMHLGTVSHKETALILWMKTTFQDYLSIMPLVFDKIHTFATPLYGFDQQILLEATQNERTFLNDRKGVIDLDNLVVDFLRRQEKAGGTSTAVAIVFNTDGLEDSEEENQSPNPSSAVAAASRKPQKGQPQPPRRMEIGFAMQGNHHKQNANGGLALSSRQSLEVQQDRGTKSSPSSKNGQKPTDSADDRQWPAIYLRSTMRLSPQARGNSTSLTASGMGLISGMRRNPNSARGSSSSALDGTASSPRPHSSGHLSQSTRSMDGSPRSTYRKRTSNGRCSLLSHGNVFEYETEPSDRPSWPHSEWGQLRTFLEMMDNGTWSTNLMTDHAEDSSQPQDRDAKAPLSLCDEPKAVTFHPDGEEPDGEGAGGSSAFFETGNSIFSSDLGKQLWDPLPSTSLPQVGNTSNAGATWPTTFHAVPLNSFMWMIVMVKGEEESRWRRKSHGLPDNEIRAFLNEMAPKLSISNRFLGLKTCQTARVKVKDRLAPRVRGRDVGLRDAQWQSDNPEDDDQVQEDVLQLMKEAFSVSGVSPMLNRAESILTQMSGFRPSGSSRSPRDRRRVLALQQQLGPFASNSDYREGAAMLFLGPELFRQFLESTSE